MLRGKCSKGRRRRIVFIDFHDVDRVSWDSGSHLHGVDWLVCSILISFGNCLSSDSVGLFHNHCFSPWSFSSGLDFVFVLMIVD